MTTGTLFSTELSRTGAASQDQIVWLHGWGQTHANLLPLARLFTKDFRNTLYDLPGFGKSPMLAQGAGTAAYADVLITELERAKGPYILAGHSFGCRVALRIAAKRPELVKAMVLIAAAGLPRKRSLAYKIRSLALKTVGKAASTADKVFKTNLKARYRNRFGSSDYRSAGALRPTFVATVTEDLSETARLVKCPVLLVYGELDSETPPEIGTRLEALLEKGALKIVKGFDHFTILTAGRHQCQHHIRLFMKTLEGL